MTHLIGWYGSRLSFWRRWVWISARAATIWIKISRGFRQSLQANFEIIPRLGQDRFLPNPFQFIMIHLLCHHSTLISRYWERRKTVHKINHSIHRPSLGGATSCRVRRLVVCDAVMHYSVLLQYISTLQGHQVDYISRCCTALFLAYFPYFEKK
jgi:hypothetical protein